MNSASTKAVNLAAKPFLNRRPVIRVAALLWALAIGVAAFDVWRYGDFFRTASSHRSRLTDLEGELANEESRNIELRRRIEALKLDEDNSTATFLNGLIHQRVFPWSRLFDDMENVLPKDVYLTGLAPKIEKIEKQKVKTRSRSRRAGNRPAPAAPPPKDIDRVAMSIDGYSRTDDAMLELVDRLYASPTFLDPVLSSEKRDLRTGLVSFSIEVVYLTRAQQPAAASAEALAAAAGGLAPETVSPGDPSATLSQDAAVEGAVGPGGSRPRATAGTPNGSPNGTPAGPPAGSLADQAGRPGGVYGQPGAVAPSQPASRPGFGPADPAVIQPGIANRPDLRQGLPGGVNGASGGTTTGRGGATPGGTVPGGVVVPPRRTPGGLNPSPSATPGLRGGG